MRKQKKSREEKIVENFFPIDEDNLKFAVEKEYKQKQLKVETLVQGNFPNKKIKNSLKKNKNIPIKKDSKKITKIEYKIPKIKLKEGGYELIITEKPQAALKIAESLGKSKKLSFNNIPYYEVKRNDKKIFVACAVGHLFSLGQINKKVEIPTFDISWFPNYLLKKGDFTKKYYDTILKLAKEASEITIATDYDIEGEVIGYNIIRFLCGQENAKRMKFSTLTNKEINESYENKEKNINFGQAIAGESRHYLDWFYGINLSRALMRAVKEAGRFKKMSIGRVQGPTLNLVVKKEKQINEFIHKKYWQIIINIDKNKEIDFKLNKDIFNPKDLIFFDSLLNKEVNIYTSKKQDILEPNPPFNLTELQLESYRLYGFTPARTLQIAQSLYLNGLISYPRTSSQKLPSSIDYKTIIEKLNKKFNFSSLIKREKPVEGKHSDPAHPSIYPTGEFQMMNEDEEKLYNLIVKRFISLFCENAIIDIKTISIPLDIKELGNNLLFSAKGSEIKTKGWLQIYPYKIKELELPDIDGLVKIIDLKKEEKETQPPKRYSPASLVSELEKRNLGTKATRAAIIETLYDRGYIKEKSIEATPLGISLIDTLEKYSKEIISEELTRNFEKEIDQILSSKKNLFEKQEKIIEEAKSSITQIIQEFNTNLLKIGKELLDAEEKSWEKEKEDNKLMLCPKCKKGYLKITYSKKNKKYFVACDNYPECKNTYSLPPNGLIKKTDKICEHCGFPMLILLKKGKKPWIFCFNPECETNKERIENYKKNLNQN
ncbi:DNA topoisomerase I [Candidatus Woesearchaeota archaeon]|jgi:DNA topoisomerase-1|nr:DNA topoisomerase I [Candidatus Woesearchaeota archaeon]